MNVYSLLYEASGCGAEDEGYIMYLEPPSVDEYDEVHEWFLPEGTTIGTPVFALVKRTARCCGAGHYFITIGTDREKLVHQAIELNTGVTQPEGLPMTDNEWRFYEESGTWPHPYKVVPLEWDVPHTPVTDAEMATLPILTLEELDLDLIGLDIDDLGLSDDIFTAVPAAE